MPIYDYVCVSCGHVFDEFARISDPPADLCPACGRTGCVSRLISGGTTGTVELKGREYFKQVIEPEARRIADRIKGGDEAAAADVFGDGGPRKKAG